MEQCLNVSAKVVNMNGMVVQMWHKLSAKCSVGGIFLIYLYVQSMYIETEE